MSVEIERHEAVCVLNFGFPVTAPDVDAIASALAAARETQPTLAVLAVLRGRVARPTPEAREAMRKHRDVLRACAQVHVVVVDRGVIAKLSLSMLEASGLLARREPAVFFHDSESRARRALRDAGFLR